MKNEFGESISIKELVDFTRRIRKLTSKQIDKLWYSCGFIISNRTQGYKALRESDINQIKNNLNSAKKTVSNLLAETTKKEFKRNLIKIEKQRK